MLSVRSQDTDDLADTLHERGSHGIILRSLGRAEYEPVWRAMQAFTDRRNAATADELWQLEHPSIYTVGIAGRQEHLPQAPTAIPVQRIDRGGQITYHGPGQVIIYTLFDLQRRKVGVRAFVRMLEQAVIDLLAPYGIRAQSRVDAPGVYVNGAKIAALGLRVRHGRCYHGLALNVDMDLTPFSLIDPCGYRGMAVVQTRDLGISDAPQILGARLGALVAERWTQKAIPT